jgi:hypothetical protein
MEKHALQVFLPIPPPDDHLSALKVQYIITADYQRFYVVDTPGRWKGYHSSISMGCKIYNSFPV